MFVDLLGHLWTDLYFTVTGTLEWRKQTALILLWPIEEHPSRMDQPLYAVIQWGGERLYAVIQWVMKAVKWQLFDFRPLSCFERGQSPAHIDI
ncbi:unnamed protein product [Arctogadus glacialis]